MLLFSMLKKLYFRIQKKNMSSGIISSKNSNEDQFFKLDDLPILKQCSSNIQRKSLNLPKQQNSSHTCQTVQNQFENMQVNLEEMVIGPSTKKGIQSAISVDISIIDERDDLLLSSTTIKSQMVFEQSPSLCEIHQKVQDIVCMAEKVKICCYCALFGHHKDHNFKSEQQLYSQIDKRAKELNQVQKEFNNLNSKLLDNRQLHIIEEVCQKWKKDRFNDIEEEYAQLISKLEEAKNQMRNKVSEEYKNLMKKARQEWKECQANLTNERLFSEWKDYGFNVIATFKKVLPTKEMAMECAAYEQFPWERGYDFMKQLPLKREQFVKNWKIQVSGLTLNDSTFKNQLQSFSTTEASNLVLTSVDNSLTSIPQNHQPYGFKTNEKISSKNSFIDMKTMSKNRHSEILETSLKPIRESIGGASKQIRNSCSGMMNSRRKQSTTSSNNWDFSAVMTNVRSTAKNQKSFLSPKTRLSACRSPRQSVNRSDPLKVVIDFEKNLTQKVLNLSNCGQEEDAILFFVQKAVNSHIPFEVNLSKNKLSQSSFVKLLPYLLKAQTANLAGTGLGQGCLDHLLKTKGSPRLVELNLLDNNINLHRNRQKIQALKQLGIKIICQ